MERVIQILCCMLLFLNVQAQTNFFERIADSAYVLTYQTVQYDPAYTSIKYPNGDVASNKGVCTDVVIRAYRKMGVDLQKEVHEDMRDNFSLYPKKWGLKKPDTNIDHRRVPNLMVFFSRFGNVKPITQSSENYKPGDIVCYDLGGNVPHIGIVSNKKSVYGKHYQIIHNIGVGQVLEDCLFNYEIIGHYQYMKR